MGIVLMFGGILVQRSCLEDVPRVYLMNYRAQDDGDSEEGE